MLIKWLMTLMKIMTGYLWHNLLQESVILFKFRPKQMSLLMHLPQGKLSVSIYQFLRSNTFVRTVTIFSLIASCLCATVE